MIEYGIACVFVCVLSAFDRRAMPYALLLTLWWILGFLPPETAPVITIIMACLIMIYAEQRKAREWWDWVIVGLLPFMAMADAWYQAGLAFGVYRPVEYAYALNIMFSVQLACVAFPGGRRIVGVGVRLGRVLFSRGWRSGLGLGKAGEAGLARKQASPVASGRLNVRSDCGLYVPQEGRGT